MISSARTLLVPVLLFSLAGCGLKGPLYLPDEQPQEVPANAPVNAPQGTLEGSKVRSPLPPAPQSQKKDRERATSPQSTPSSTQGTPTQSAPPPVSPPDPDRPATTPRPPGQ